MAHARVTVAARLSCVLLALALGACATSGGPDRPASESEKLAFADAISPLPGDPQAAMKRLEDFTRQHPESPLADDAGEKLAQLALQQGDRMTARRWLTWVVESHPNEDRADSARVGLAQLEKDDGDPESARRRLSRLRVSRLTPVQQAQAYTLLADLATDPSQRLRWLGQLRASVDEPERIARIDDEIDTLIAAMTVEDLENSVSKLGGGVPAGRIRLRLAGRALDAGDLERAEWQLVRAQRTVLTERDRALKAEVERRLELREEITASGLLPTAEEVSKLPPPRTDGATGTLGVVLPLSGSFARFGEESLRGVLLAAGIFEPIESIGRDASVAIAGTEPGEDEFWRQRPGAVRLLVRDSQGTPAGAAAAVHDLASHDDLVAIVGPLLSSESEAAAAAAEEEGVPLLTLTSREEVARTRDYVFRLRTTPSDEVRFLVDYAVDQLGARTFAILYPADNYGRGMRSHFWSAVEERGGWVVGAGSYAPDATDFARPIRRMIGYELLTAGEREALGAREEMLKRGRRLPPEQAAEVRKVAYELLGPEGERLPPIVDFDALFIPDSADKVILLAPQLSFHDVLPVQLLGTGGWDHPDLVRFGQRHVRGAAMASLFHAESRFTFVSDFVERYGANFDSSPDVFGAVAFDAANLVLVQLAAGHDSRSGVREGLLNVHGYPGASGVTSFLPDGNARKRPFLLGVRGRRIVPLD